MSRSHKKKKPGYKKRKPGYKKKSHCDNFQSYNSKPSYHGKKPKYKKKKKKKQKRFGHHHRLFKVPKRPFGHHVHIDSKNSIDNSNESNKKKKKVLRQSSLGLINNNKAFLAGHSATWLQGHSRRMRNRRRHKLKSLNGLRENGRLSSFPRILKDTLRGGKRTIHIGV